MAVSLKQYEALKREVQRLKEQNAELQEALDMSCITPTDNCQCSGCLYAEEHRKQDSRPRKNR